MPKKLAIDSLSSEITSLKALLESAKQSDDVVGAIQFEYRIDELNEKLNKLKEESTEDNLASVALFFGGKPVLGSKGIAAKFAGTAIEQFQNLISKTFAINEIGELAKKGKVPFKEYSDLMVTGLARGSFGFVLDEMSTQTELESSQLSIIVEKVAHLIANSTSQDESVFEQMLEELDPRTLIALKDFFSNLDSNQATLRVVENDFDMSFDSYAIHRARLRTEATSIEEKTTHITGELVGFLPEHKKFEIRNNDGDLIYGSASKEAVEKFEEMNQILKNRKVIAEVTEKTVAPLNRPPKKVYRLLNFDFFIG